MQDEYRPSLAGTGFDRGEVREIAPVRCAYAEGQFGVWCRQAEIWTRAELALALEVFDLGQLVDVDGFFEIERCKVTNGIDVKPTSTLIPRDLP